MSSWKEIREEIRGAYRDEINTLTSDEIIQKLALKGAIRTLDERFATAEAKADVVGGNVSLPSLSDLAKSAAGATLADRAKVVRSKVFSALQAGTIGYDKAEKIMSLLVKPTKETISQAEMSL